MRRSFNRSMRWMTMGALSVGLFLPIACGGKVVFVAEGATGSGGHGGQGGASSSSPMSSSIASTPSDATGVTTQGSTGNGPPPCIPCSQVLNGAAPTNLCPGSSQSAYDTLVQCICATGCPASCGDNLCANANVTPTCSECINSTCASQLMGCTAN